MLVVDHPALFSDHPPLPSGPCPSNMVRRVTTGLCLLSLSRGTSVPLVCSENLADACTGEERERAELVIHVQKHALIGDGFNGL